MSHRILSLQALRAVGAISVVLFHAASLSGGVDMRLGASGVDLFFIISGTVMSLSVDERTRIPEFLWKRFVRVVPLYWLATIGAIAIFCSKAGYLPDASNIWQSVFFLPPEHGVKFPLLYPGWSLNYEMFFYALIALLLLFGRNAMQLTLIVTISLGAAWRSVHVPYLGYYCSPGLLEFSMGILIGIAIRHRFVASRAASFTMIAAGCLILALQSQEMVLNAAIAYGLPWAMILVGAMSFEASRVIQSRVTQLLGAASYSIYLMHPFIIWGVEAITKSRSGILFVISVFLCVLAGLIVHISLERPILSRLGRMRMRTGDRVAAQ